MLIENQLKKLGFGTAALFLLIVAALLGASQMYLMAIIVGLVPVAGWLLGRISILGLTCDRIVPETADERAKTTVSLTIRNGGRFPKFFLRAVDMLPRYVMYAGTPPDESAFISQLWPGEMKKIRYMIEPQRRGAHRIGPLTILATDVFGFSEARVTVAGSSEILVYPEILPVTPTLLSGGASAGWRDEMNARSRGDGIDFTGVREYRQGDELRRINWKTTARTGALAVTEYTQGFATDLMVVLDRQLSAYELSGEGAWSTFEIAVKIANALGATALRQGSAVQLMTLTDEEDHVIRMSDYAHISVLLDKLARVEADASVGVEYQLMAARRELDSSTILTVITPRSPDDPKLRGELQSWSLNPSSAGVNVFWLDKKSFQLESENARAGIVSGTLRTSKNAGSKRRSEIGCEYGVDAQTDLIALLGDSSVA